MTTTDVQGNVCPAGEYRFQQGPDAALDNFRRLDAFQAASRPYLRTDEAEGYWVFTDSDVILEGLQKPELFSSTVITPTDPNPLVKWIPVMLDPPDHGKWRKLLGAYFSPGRVERLEAEQRQFAVDLIERFRASGSCDYYADFAGIFPTTIFLQIMGLPIDRLDDFMVWEGKILHATAESDPDHSIAFGAMMEVVGYFQGLITERRENPDSRGDDIVSHAIDWRIDGEAPSDEDLLSCMLLLFMAGLDTVAAQLTYAVHHLATHPEHRARLAADPAQVPHAVEELLRAYPIVQTARRATQDLDFHGCPLKAGDMVAFPLGMAGRDPKTYERAGEVDLDAGPVRHISFGAGPHRCLGSHLARQEMVVALQELLRLVPDFEVADPDKVVEHSGGVYSIECLPLRWPA